MTTEEFNKLLNAKLLDCQGTLAFKAGEYAHGGDRLSNFKRAGAMLGCSPERALLGFVTKHITALYDFVADLENGAVRSEDQWSEKTGDIRNYMLLLDALLVDRAGTSSPAASNWSGCEKCGATPGDRCVCHQ